MGCESLWEFFPCHDHSDQKNQLWFQNLSFGQMSLFQHTTIVILCQSEERLQSQCSQVVEQITGENLANRTLQANQTSCQAGGKRRYSTLCETCLNRIGMILHVVLIIATFPSNIDLSPECPVLNWPAATPPQMHRYHMMCVSVARHSAVNSVTGHHLCDQCKSIKTVRQLTIDATRRGTGNPQLAGGPEQT